MEEEKDIKTDDIKKEKNKTTTRKNGSTAKKQTTKAVEKKNATVKKTTTKKVSAAKKDENSRKADSKKTKATSDEAKTKSSVSYCAHCGRKLKSNEKCNCLNQLKEIKDAKNETLVERGKGLLDIIIDIYKKPFSSAKEQTLKSDVKNGLSLIVLIALSLGLLITSLTYATFHVNVGVESFGSYYNISYFKIFIVWSFVGILFAVLPTLISYASGILFTKKKFEIANAINLYASTMSVVIFVNIVAAVFIFAGLFVKFFLLLAIAAVIFGCTNYFIVYTNLMEFNKDNESYILLGIIAIWVLSIAVLCSMFTSGVDGLNAVNTFFSTMNG